MLSLIKSALLFNTLALVLHSGFVLPASAMPSGPPTVFQQLFAPNGVTLDKAGNIFVHSDTGTQNIITKFTPDGQNLGSVGIGGFFDIGLTGRLTVDPSTGILIELTWTGQSLLIDPDTGELGIFFDLRSAANVRLDATRVFDIALGEVRDFSGNILPGFINYGDLAILRRGDQIDLFVTGVSIITSFVMRIRLDPNGRPPEAKVLIASQIQVGGDVPFGRPLPTPSNPNSERAGFINVPRGVAVNSQGTVLTSLPDSSGVDVGVTFNADFDPGFTERPTIILNGQDLFSRGMTTDAAGNFYLATGSIGISACGAGGSGALVIIPRSLNTFFCATLEVGIADSLDVAVTPSGDRAFMTILNLGAVVDFPLTPLGE